MTFLKVQAPVIAFLAAILFCGPIPRAYGETSEEVLEEAIFDSGPYPRLLSIPIAEKLSIKNDVWKIRLIKTLRDKGRTRIDEAEGDVFRWQPLSEDDPNIRTNFDRNYEKLDYTLVLGSIDVDILSMEIHEDASATARIQEELDKNPLYEDIVPLLPKEYKNKFSSAKKTLIFKKAGESYTLKSIK